MLAALGTAACPRPDTAPAQAPVTTPTTTPEDESNPVTQASRGEFQVQVDQFADLRVLRYRIPGFEDLPLEKKKLAYYLYEAALSGRDIIWDQNYRHNLLVRHTLEGIVRTYGGERSGADWDAFLVYAKRVWFSNGIHHHYSMKKILPEFPREYLGTLVRGSDADELPLTTGQTVDQLVTGLEPILFDPKLDAKRVDLDPSKDLVAASATNYYGPGVTQKQVEGFYAKRTDKKDPHPISHGLNSQLAKDPKTGKLVERVWKVDGMYGPAIAEIVTWLRRAIEVAEGPEQRAALEKLVAFYETGDLRTFDEYSIAWVADTDSTVDVVNGFIEVYGDPLGYRGAFESVVSIRDMEASKRIDAISKQAQWFEDQSTIPQPYKKKDVKGISAKVITVVVESGDASPSTPIGINLPNANWIRAEHGSKSVNLGNIVAAYDESSKQTGVLEEFAGSPEEIGRARAHGELADALHTDMHEVIGHASGAIKPGVGTPKETLKNYASTLEEGRADLVALYYLLDPKLIEIGVMPSLEVGMAAYDDYIRSGLMVQLARLELGEDLEEAHMRNRQMVAKWVYEKGKADKVIEQVDRDGKTYFVVRDYAKLRELFGQLLREVQRIKSEGDYAAGKALVEGYGVKVDRALHEQVLRRYEALKIAPYAGFINPRLVPVMEGEELVDVRVEYPDNFVMQMLEYGEVYRRLPVVN
ncbi:dipeptidyl-peptidase 3 family protein [Paraliomyxa miuraensis]|uniref:dipeptidyl-peptidase 3 family protein n=1 Tax=Paraliomyxa miuraensis TaxID=376150 RepID=UPI00224FA82A|nr:dihydrofolate reductase [Paraliomyxa miuraensis]MCX4246442.1 dipeptidyl peptidase 3 [Paraliomyxa miuraensis]